MLCQTKGLKGSMAKGLNGSMVKGLMVLSSGFLSYGLCLRASAFQLRAFLGH